MKQRTGVAMASNEFDPRRRVYTYPLHGPLWHTLAATAPVAKLDSHWSLWVILATNGERVIEAQCANSLAINNPLDAIAVPVDRVDMESILRIRYRNVLDTIVSGRVALAEEIGLDTAKIVSRSNLSHGRKYVQLTGTCRYR